MIDEFAALDPAELTTAVQSTPGVTDVYPPLSALGGIPDHITAWVRGRDVPQRSAVTVNEGSGLIEVDARVAVNRAASSPDVARAVADELLHRSERARHGNVRVSVQVTRIG